MAASNLNFTDLRIRVAEFLGIADYSSGAAGLPTDAHDLDLVGRIVNDGYHRFITEQEWSFLFPTLEVTLTSSPAGTGLEKATYDLPADFGGLVDHTMTFQDSGQSVRQVYNIPEQQIRATFASGEVNGTPHWFATRVKAGLDPTTTAADPRHEIIFWPIPNLDGVVVGRYNRVPTRMVADSDRPVSGPFHDRTVLSAVLAEAELTRDDSAGVHEERYQNQLGKSITRDRRSRPARILDYGPKPKGQITTTPFPSSIDFGGTTIF